MMDTLEDVDDHLAFEKRRYQLCRAGFGILSGALILALISTILTLLPMLLLGQQLPAWIHNSAFWMWIDAPIVWGSLFGCYLLWGRWDDRSWQRRTGLILVMGMIDALLWIIKHSQELGFAADPVGHSWLRSNLGQALGWAEFALLTSLACGMLSHLDVTQAVEAGKSTRSLVMTGSGLFMLLFLVQTDWERGWPLHYRPAFTVMWRLLDYASMMIWTIILIQVTALSIAATRQLGVVVQRMNDDEASNDPWGSPAT